jgi:hypothetical protein
MTLSGPDQSLTYFKSINLLTANSTADAGDAHLVRWASRESVSQAEKSAHGRVSSPRGIASHCAREQVHLMTKVGFGMP